MKLDKKGIGTTSSFLIASLLGVSLLIIVGILVNGMSSIYSISSVDYFDGYEDVYSDISGVASDYAGDYDPTVNETIPETSTTEDMLFIRAFKILGKIPKLLGGLSNMVFRISGDLGIPSAVTVLIIGILGIVVITLLVKVIRGYDNV